MKIRKIRFQNHPILGSIELNFTTKDGKAIDTIIVAGENGVGKSVLLNTIYEFSNLRPSDKKRSEKRTFEIELSEDEIQILRNSPEVGNSFKQHLYNNILNVSIDYSIINAWEQIQITADSLNMVGLRFDGHIFVHRSTQKVIGSIFSDAEISFTPERISSVTAKNIDMEWTQSEKSSSKIATEVTQLLIDVQSLDALEFAEWARENVGKAVDENRMDN